MSVAVQFGTQNGAQMMSPIITEKFGKDMKGKLFLGSATAASNKNLIMNNEISAVLTIANDLNLRYPKDIIHDHKVIKVEDNNSEILSEHFDECIEFLAKHLNEGRSVLIHCMAGISRSPSIVIAFLIKNFNWTYQRAFDFVKEKRPEISPNANFIRQLKTLDSSSRGRK